MVFVVKKVAGILGLFALVGLVGCDAPVPMSASEIAQATKGQPEVIVEVNGKLTLDDMREFYLGQPEAEAMAALEARCDAIVPYEGGWLRGNTYFRGCILPDDPELESIRVGFHPEMNGAVFTLEEKRKGWSPELVRARFAERFGDELTRDLPRRGTVRMETPDHLMFGSWDSGTQGPAHVIFGMSPEAVEKFR